MSAFHAVGGGTRPPPITTVVAVELPHCWIRFALISTAFDALQSNVPFFFGY